MLRFSVIIPCFNCASTIDATIGSLKGQTLKDWEAICIDDGSSDHTLRILKSYAAQDDRIHVIRQGNAGPSCARNAGAAISKGQYIAFLDSDDVWSAHKLESTLSAFTKNSGVHAVFGRVGFFNEASPKVATLSDVKQGLAELTDFVGENPVCTLSNLTVARAAFLESGGFDEAMHYAEDLEWLIRALSDGMKIVSTSDLHVYYRTSSDGLSSDLLAMHDGWRQAVASAASLLSKRQLLAAEAIHLRYLARRALRTGASPRVAWTLATRGILLAPRAFLNDRYRGSMTLLGCLASPVVPLSLRTRIFA